MLQTYLWNTDAARRYPLYIAEEKTQGPFGNEILRAFFANYLVCLAMWQATAAQDIIGKIFGIFFPVLCFVAIGFSHTVGLLGTPLLLEITAHYLHLNACIPPCVRMDRPLCGGLGIYK